MIFDNDLTTHAEPPLPIVVAKWDKQVHVILACKQWAGVRTHWYGGHTIACCGTDACPACGINQQWVKKFYIVGQHPRTGNRAIVMLTPLAAAEIVRHSHVQNGVLGCEVLIGRAAKRNTAPMTAKLVSYHPSMDDFGTARLQRVVTRIFRENQQIAAG